MKKIIILIFILIVFALYSEIIIEINDEIRDDYGSGQISYPENPIFTEGIFDITTLEIIKEEDYYKFVISLNGKLTYVDHDEFQYNYNLGDEFFLPLITIYLDKDHVEGSGFTKTIYGTNATINPESAWESVVVIASLADRFRGELNRTQPEIAHNAFIPNKPKIARDKKSISVKIPEKIIGEISPAWGFTVLMHCQEFSQTIAKSIYIKDIKTTTSMMNFGGGTGNFLGNYDPNIIDLIVPLGEDQRKILSNYDAEDKVFTELFAYYPQYSATKRLTASGLVKQVSDEKVVVDLGSENGVIANMELIIDNRIVVVASDVFPKLVIAKFKNSEDWETIEEGMSVIIKK